MKKVRSGEDSECVSDHSKAAMLLPLPAGARGGGGVPGAGVTGRCEPFSVGSRNQTQVLWKRSKCSSPLSHFSSPFLSFSH